MENFLLSKGCTGDYNIIGYTTYQKRINDNDHRSQFQANELFYGAPRYDWCLVQFEGNDIASNLQSPAQILGFLKFPAGTPSPYLVDDLLLSPEHIANHSSQDDNFYAVVHTATSYLSRDTLVKEFVSTIKLGDPYTHTYIVNVETIKDCLNVSLNWGGEGNKYFVRLPYRHWDNYFGLQIKKL